MLDIVVLVIMAVAAVRSGRTLHRAHDLFREFGVSRAVVPLICLFPVAPLVWLATRQLAGWLPAAVIALACYVPALLMVGRARVVFERSGTDRTADVLDALSVAWIVAIGGIAYVAACIAFSLIP